MKSTPIGWKQSDWDRAEQLLLEFVKWQRGIPVNERDREQIKRFLTRYQSRPEPQK